MPMPRVKWHPFDICSRLKQFVVFRWLVLKISCLSLCCNAQTTIKNVPDYALEPLFWFIDKFGASFGPMFVSLVIIGTTFVVSVFYVFLLPWIYETSFWLSAFHTVFGHWLLLNVVFHYYMALTTPPGNPPQSYLIKHIVTICKKCITPKPPRSHHCSICHRCIMKMDHHCPWLNNCVGHQNHRFFFLFCVYMWVGTVYVCFSDWPLFKEHFWRDLMSWLRYPKDTPWPGVFMPLPFWNFANLLNLAALQPMNYSNIFDNGTVPDGTLFRSTHRITHFCIILEFTLCFGVSIALGALTAYHFRLVSRGETSIESHINTSEDRRLAKFGIKYKNPYNFGFKENWKIFLGLNNGRTFVRHVLFPSSHKPEGDGISWRTSTYSIDDNDDDITTRLV